MGTNGLLAEAVGWLLSRQLSIPTPDAAVGYPDDDNERCWLSQRLLHVTHWSPDIIPHLYNLEVLGRMVALDVLVLNEDRHIGNLLIQYEGLHNAPMVD